VRPKEETERSLPFIDCHFHDTHTAPRVSPGLFWMTTVDLDYALLRKTSQGDQQAFAELMRRHQDRVYRLAWRLLRHTQEAEDATQEIFLKVYQNAGRFTPTGSVSAWLNRITANHCLNLLRSRQVKKEVAWEDLNSGMGQARDIAAMASGAGNPLDQVTGRECALKIQQALAGLPENQRQALVLKRFGDFSYQEIGEMLGLSASAVDGLIKRARQNLRQALGEYFES
jgi:RNA polymerase sigma-70 factor, ECF subfamily